MIAAEHGRWCEADFHAGSHWYLKVWLFVTGEVQCVLMAWISGIAVAAAEAVEDPGWTSFRRVASGWGMEGLRGQDEGFWPRHCFDLRQGLVGGGAVQERRWFLAFRRPRAEASRARCSSQCRPPGHKLTGQFQFRGDGARLLLLFPHVVPAKRRVAIIPIGSSKAKAVAVENARGSPREYKST